MTINRKIVLMSLLFLVVVVGTLISYRAFHINERDYQQISKKAGQEVAGWVAQNLEHRLLQLEASASYLDQSTVESLKRLGARYFAYVYKKQDEWSVKWKKLGFLEKEKILGEVNEIDFNKINSEKRTWHFNRDHELIYVTPVVLARSHQLREGFLVFGLRTDFFKFIQSKKSSVVLLTEKYEALEGDFPPELRDRKEDIDKDKQGMMDIQVKKEKESLIFISYFSPLSQLWVVHSRSLPFLSYFESLFFYYFLISTGLGFLLLLLFGGKFVSFSLFQDRGIDGSRTFAEGRQNPEAFESSENKKEKEKEKEKEVFTQDSVEISSLSSHRQVDRFQSESIHQTIHSDSLSFNKGKKDQQGHDESSGEIQTPVNLLDSPKPELPEKEKSLAEIEKQVEEAIGDFQLKKFNFEDSKTDSSISSSDGSGFQGKSEKIKSRIRTDEHGLFEFDNGQFKIKIRPPKKKDRNVDC